MTNEVRSVCWIPSWNDVRKGMGLEHLLLREGAADSVVLAFDDDGRPYRLSYQLTWEPTGQLRTGRLAVTSDSWSRSLALRTDGLGQWYDADRRTMAELQGCRDIDIWPTPFTNSFPLWREPLEIGERREFRVAWVSAPDLTIVPRRQAYSRLSERVYLFEDLDGSGFQAELSFDEDGLVVDYPGLFRRVPG